MPRVVISGGGIAGTVVAYWLGKNGFDVVVIERSAPDTIAGQIIDVEGPARDVVERMGVMDEIKSKVTHEAGVRIVNDSGQEIAKFPAGNVSFSNEIEIMRPDLAGILLKAADSHPNVEFRYNRTIQGIQQNESRVAVTISERGNDVPVREDYDYLISCDGLRSPTRDMILPEADRESCLKTIQSFVAFFSIPAQPEDRPFATFLNAARCRGVFLKPLTDEETSAYLMYTKFDQRLRDAREQRDVKLQKQLLREIFQGSGWETERILKGMEETHNFYFEEITQVKLDKWSEGRCVLLGDTAYCPSPLTGQGTALALLGSYVLAAKLVANPEEPTKAFEEYEKEFRPYVNKAQPIPLGGYMPKLLIPESRWGVGVLRSITSFICWAQIWKFMPAPKKPPYDLPEL